MGVADHVNLDGRAYRVAAWVGLAVHAVAVVAAFVVESWEQAVLLGGFWLAAFALLAFDRRLPSVFDLLFVVAALANGAGWVWHLFERVSWYDEVVHAFTTFAVALAGGFLVYYSVRHDFKGHAALFVLAVTSFGLAMGAGWEVVEFVFDWINGVEDTIVDLVMDGLGALAAGLLAAWAVQREPEHQLID